MPNLLSITPNLTVDIMFSVSDLKPGTVHRSVGVPKVPGGKGINVARVTRILGHHAEVAGFLAGYIGRFAEASYAADGLTGHYVWYEGETRVSILVDEPGGRSTVLNDAGEPLDAKYVAEMANTIRAISHRFDWVSLSGSVPPGAPPQDYQAVLDAARPAKLAVDSHGAMLPQVAHTHADLLRINHFEASELLGWPVRTVEDGAKACKELHRWGSASVAISMGELGAVALGLDNGAEQCWHFDAPKVAVISNIGAGDAMFAGMLSGFMDGLSFVDATRQGVASGSACCTVQNPGSMPIETMRQILPQVVVTRLS